VNPYRVPNLYFVGHHIAVTLIAGCTTECGLPLKVGQNWTRDAPQHVCKACHDAVNTRRGGARIAA
jgi:hypothetical protein